MKESRGPVVPNLGCRWSNCRVWSPMMPRRLTVRQEEGPYQITGRWFYEVVTLQGTNISPQNGILKMIFLFPRWDMLIPWRVLLKFHMEPEIWNGPMKEDISMGTLFSGSVLIMRRCIYIYKYYSAPFTIFRSFCMLAVTLWRGKAWKTKSCGKDLLDKCNPPGFSLWYILSMTPVNNNLLWCFLFCGSLIFITLL